jgi:hypothetical protein
MLNSKSQAILTELSAISTATVLKYPITGIKDPSKSMLAFIDLSEFGEESFEDYGIFNLPEFMQVINLVDDAKIELDNGVIGISNDSSSIKYYTTNTDLLEETYAANPKVRDNITKAFTACNFTLDEKTLDKLKKTSSLMKLEHLVVNSVGDNVSLEITDTSMQSSNNFKLNVPANEANEDSRIVLKMELLRKLPASNYEVKVAKNATTGSYITMFSSKDIPTLDIVILVVAED